MGKKFFVRARGGAGAARSRLTWDPESATPWVSDMNTPAIVRNRFNTNAWNRTRYSLLAPGYDWFVRFARSRRRRSLALLNLQPGARVLIIGAGTGLDLEFIPRQVNITAIDLTPAMVSRLKARAAHLKLKVDARVMDGQSLEFPKGSFDAIVLHLIVAVIPDPVRCVREAARVLRTGGRAVILDKFAPEGRKPPWTLRLLNPVLGFLASEVTRQLRPILAPSAFRVVHEEPAGLGGFFKIVLMEKAG